MFRPAFKAQCHFLTDRQWVIGWFPAKIFVLTFLCWKAVLLLAVCRYQVASISIYGSVHPHFSRIPRPVHNIIWSTFVSNRFRNVSIWIANISKLNKNVFKWNRNKFPIIGCCQLETCLNFPLYFRCLKINHSSYQLMDIPSYTIQILLQFSYRRILKNWKKTGNRKKSGIRYFYYNLRWVGVCLSVSPLFFTMG